MYAESFWRLVARPNVFSGFFTGTANNISDNKETFAVKLQVCFEIGSVEIINEPFSKNSIYSFFFKATPQIPSPTSNCHSLHFPCMKVVLETDELF